jgi:GWxTD domain-containing protein
MLVPFLSGASTSWGETVDELTEWAEGPVQWLLLSEERKQIRRVSTSREATTFVEEFWTLRDPQPDEPGNPYREAFAQRVEAADVLYGEGRTRGSLTDRGRALILLGPPTHVTISTEPALAWDPVESSDSRVTMRRVDVEIWGYRFEDLPPGLVELWLEKKKKAAENTLTLTVMFRTVAHRTALVEGEALLETASRAAVTSSD